jgi:hypothetical protein
MGNNKSKNVVLAIGAFARDPNAPQSSAETRPLNRHLHVRA